MEKLQPKNQGGYPVENIEKLSGFLKHSID
jgi:hypothetical protein